MFYKSQMGIGITSLLANAQTRSTFRGEKYYFAGDLCQMSAAQGVADSLGIRTYIEGGIPFVGSAEEYNDIKNYLISNQINGWWHYTTC